MAGAEAYHILERIGEGSFGRVYKGRRKCTGQFVALKFMSKSGKTPKELAALRSELAILQSLDHPNIILMLDCFETAKDVVLVTEYAHGELFQILLDDKALPEGVVQSVARQLVAALHYLHSHRIVHRDMKPQNVLVGSGGTVKLADFGFARQMSASTIMLTSIKGTPLYLAPEIFHDQAYEYKADLWGLGVMLYELCAGRPPFYANSLHALMKLIMEEDITYPTTFSPPMVDFLSSILVRNPTERAGWPALLHHPWVAPPPTAALAAPPPAAVLSIPRGVAPAGASTAAAATAAAAAVAAPAPAPPAAAAHAGSAHRVGVAAAGVAAGAAAGGGFDARSPVGSPGMVPAAAGGLSSRAVSAPRTTRAAAAAAAASAAVVGAMHDDGGGRGRPHDGGWGSPSGEDTLSPSKRGFGYTPRVAAPDGFVSRIPMPGGGGGGGGGSGTRR